MEAERIHRSGTLLNKYPRQYPDCFCRSRPALWGVLGAGPIPAADRTGATEAPEGDSGDYCAKPGTTGSIRAQPRQEKAETAP